MILGLSVAAAVVILDQLSKYWIKAHVLADAPVIALTSFFNLVTAWNTGVSFSMFNDGGWFGIVALSVLALGIVMLLLNWLRREDNPLIQTAIGFIIGGAIGNVIDRIRLGAVFDFLDFHIAGQHWPAFNAADSFICIGAVIIIVHSIFWGSGKVEKGENK